jgi:hypothetical protein
VCAGVGEGPDKSSTPSVFLRKKIRFEEPGNQEADIPSFQNKTLKFAASCNEMTVKKLHICDCVRCTVKE